MLPFTVCFMINILAHSPSNPSLCKNILVFIYAKARILIFMCLLNACTILKKVLWLADTQSDRICTSHLKDTRVNRSALCKRSLNPGIP